MKISQIYTRKNSDLGVDLPIDFAGIQDNPPTIKICGVDGERYRKAMEGRAIENARVLTLPESEQAEAHAKADQSLVAEMILDWSFSEKCTLSNKLKLLENSPGVFDLVNTSVFKRSLFMGE